MKNKGFTLIELLIVLGILSIVGTWLTMSFTDIGDSRPLNVATNLGFSNPKVVDRSYFLVSYRGCGGEDSIRYTVNAINPINKPATLNICCGLIFKGCTMRGN